MTQEEFNRAIAEKKAKAEEVALAIPSASKEEFPALLREFVRCKFLLDPQEMTTDHLTTLGRISTNKIIGIRNQGIEFKDKAAGCTSASSDVIKKVLLAMALGKILGMKLDPDDVANVDTIDEMAELILQKRG